MLHSINQDDQDLESSIDELLAGLGDFDENNPKNFKWIPNAELNLDKLLDELQECVPSRWLPTTTTGRHQTRKS
jgi:hypothetical protein